MKTGVPANEVRSRGFIDSSVKCRAKPKSANLIWRGGGGGGEGGGEGRGGGGGGGGGEGGGGGGWRWGRMVRWTPHIYLPSFFQS